MSICLIRAADAGHASVQRRRFHKMKKGGTHQHRATPVDEAATRRSTGQLGGAALDVVTTS
jgi:hypothetical protein